MAMSSPHFLVSLKEDLTSHCLPDMQDSIICCQFSPVAQLGGVWLRMENEKMEGICGWDNDVCGDRRLKKYRLL